MGGGAAGDDLEAVTALLDAGSGSLGGARPKASVRGDDGHLLLAKFPHGSDDWDVMAWEKTMLDVAREAGLRVPRSHLTKVGPRHVLLLERFDRAGKDVRLGYISAMTLLGARDGDQRDYADIAEALPESGAAVKNDLHELFARVVFSVAVHNTDDHLRNQGFIRQRAGWTLSPVFDINPNPDLGRRRVTSILGATDAEQEIEALADFAPSCRLSPTQASDVIRRVTDAVGQWRSTAARNGITATEISLFAPAIDTQQAALGSVARS